MIEVQAQTAAAAIARSNANTPPLHRLLPPAIIILGLALNAACVVLLGYGFVSIVRFAF
jgi:hypothetical protein